MLSVVVLSVVIDHYFWELSTFSKLTCSERNLGYEGINNSRD